MRKLLVSVAAVAAVAMFAVSTAGPAGSKPTTTTGTTTTTTAPPPPVEVLGVPHEVVQLGIPGNMVETLVLCPGEEVAVSITFSMPAPAAGQFALNADPVRDTHSPNPANRPNGYNVYTSNNITVNAHLLCAPVVST